MRVNTPRIVADYSYMYVIWRIAMSEFKSYCCIIGDQVVGSGRGRCVYVVRTTTSHGLNFRGTLYQQSNRKHYMVRLLWYGSWMS